MAKIYDSNGWVNWDYLMSDKSVIKMVVGARAVGKTYGIFKKCLQDKKKFIYLRRLKTQLDLCASPAGNPFKKICTDLDISIVPVKTKDGIILFRLGGKDGEIVAAGVALSTIATVRGVDFSEYDVIIFDESIAMENEKPIKGEFNALLNFYETVNRNRPLEGLPDVVMVLLGNANKLSNPYFTGWHFTKTAIKMIRGGQMVYRTPDGTRMMVLLLNSPISCRKSETALYQNASKDFLDMALDNAFRTDATNIHSEPLKEYKHIVSVGEIAIYRHKSDRKYYVCGLVQSPYYEAFGIQLKMFVQDYFHLRINYMVNKNIVFEDFENELLFREYFDLK